MMRRFGLIGKTLKHSFSKNYFAHKFEEAGSQDCSYENFELPDIEAFPELIRNNPDLVGLNVTIPYKESVLQFLDDTDEMVKEIGACNCIKVVDGKLTGYNTDAIAFQTSLQTKLKSQHTAALVLGSGGASKAIQYALTKLKINFEIVSRSRKPGHIGYEDLGPEVLEDHLVIINTTPLGLYPNVDADPSIPYEFITSKHLLFDLIYNPPKTKFLEKGEQKGAAILNGYNMLVGQAEESWRIWAD